MLWITVNMAHDHRWTTYSLVVELKVVHLLGSHYEIWRGWPGTWVSDSGIELTRRRRRILNRTYRRIKDERVRRWTKQGGAK